MLTNSVSVWSDLLKTDLLPEGASHCARFHTLILLGTRSKCKIESAVREIRSIVKQRLSEAPGSLQG